MSEVSQLAQAMDRVATEMRWDRWVSLVTHVVVALGAAVVLVAAALALVREFHERPVEVTYYVCPARDLSQCREVAQ